MDIPAVSVIMSVYNGARDAPRAIRSILNQTFHNLELIAIDNGSFKDDTRAVLRAIASETGDPRLRVVALDANIGLAGALNHGIGLARARLIARQDHDDLSDPTRLAKQVAYMEANPGCGLLGTRAEIWIGDTPTERAHDHPTSNAHLQAALLANNPFVHSSVMIRRDVIDRVGRYATDPVRQPPEDFEFWSRIARVAEVANLPERLVVYREMPASMSREGPAPFLDKLILICAENIAHAAGLDAPDAACHDAAALTHAAYDRLSPSGDLEAAVRVVERALAGISERNGGVDLSAVVAERVANLRHHYGFARKVPSWMKRLVETTRRWPIPPSLRARARGWLMR